MLIFLRQFLSPLIYILLAAAAVSLIVGEIKDAFFILAVLVLNALIGAFQEYRAERTSQSLKQLLQFHARVRRDQKPVTIDSTQVVPGDVVVMEPGDRVPADLRLVEGRDLHVDESLLTGESLPVPKWAERVLAVNTPLAERSNLLFAGSMVTRGRGFGVVTETGTQTTVGQLSRALDQHSGKPPLLLRMERFTNLVAIFTLVAAVTIGLIQLLISDSSLIDVFFFVVALAVSAIPEGLPVAMTITLAVAASRMARRNVIVRRLAAVEGLGSCTLVATDKTGTLTCNELTVQRVLLQDGTRLDVTGEGFQARGSIQLNGVPVARGQSAELEQLVEGVTLCNEAKWDRQPDGHCHWHGDTVDVALLVLAGKLGQSVDAGYRQSLVTASIPYESERQFAAVFVTEDDSDELSMIVKGAPERILDMCRTSDGQKSGFHADAESLASEGLRVIGVARGRVAAADAQRYLGNEPVHGLDFLGFVGMHDPLRPEVFGAVTQCQQAGVRIIMVTGDHRSTALSIGRQLGLASHESEVCTGSDLEQATAQESRNLIQTRTVFARVTPEQKLQLVQAARAVGHFVAVTGDGVNDAPALKAANIGVAMGKAGTDVAHEAAELVLADDNFASIVHGVEEGRIAYDNIRKVVFLLVAMGAAELLLMLLAVLTGMPLPLLPVQLLWLNLVTDGIQGVALAFEPGEGDSLSKPPRKPEESLFNRLMIERIAIAVTVVGVGGFLVFYFSQQAGYQLEHSRNLLLLTMVLFENVHVGNCRSETRSAFSLSPLRSPILLVGTVIAFLVHVLSLYIPLLRQVLLTSPLSPGDWLIAILVSLTIVPAVELHKWWWNRRDSIRQNTLLHPRS